jgi:hypothetical protein
VSVVVDECVLTLRSSQLEVQVLSSRGGRVLSLRNVADDREWLAQRRRDDLESPPALDSVFTDADHCGWDEMFPTVDPCDFPGEPFLGVGVPDHGELWSRPWEVEMATATTLVQHVRSERFGYFFQRTLRLDGGVLRCDYLCRLEADAAVPLLWALHPQFSARTGTHLVLAGDRVTTLDTTEPKEITDRAWPGDLIVARDVVPGEDLMLFLHLADSINRAELIDPSGSWLRVEWDHSFAPFLGIWADNGRFTDGQVIAIEPTNGFLGNLASAHDLGLVSTFSPGIAIAWWVEISVGGSGE